MKKVRISVDNLKTIKDQVNYSFEDESFVEKKEFIGCSFIGSTESSEFEKNIFKNCSLKDIRFNDFFIKNVGFDNCYAHNTLIKASKIVCSIFKNSKLLGISFNSCIGVDINFINCNIQFADFRNIKLTGTVFKDCNLREADFQSADLRGVVFKNCDLRETQFSFAKLTNTNFSGSKIEGIKVQYENLQGAVVDYNQAAYLGSKYLKLRIE